MDQSKRNIYLTVIVVVLLAAMSTGMFVNKILTPRVMSKQELRNNGALLFEKPRIIREINLLDHNGAPFTAENLQGKWTLAFFGFVACPDICPTTMVDMKKFKGMLADTDVLDDTQILLVTVDPARDTPETLKPYVEYFDPSFIGVTGEFLNILSFATDLGVAFQKVPLEGGNYTVDHSPYIALINPYGHYHAIFKPQATQTTGQFDPGKLKVTYLSIREAFQG